MEELRVAGDGGCYTKRDFLNYYGDKGEKLWQEAPVAPKPKPEKSVVSIVNPDTVPEEIRVVMAKMPFLRSGALSVRDELNLTNCSLDLSDAAGLLGLLARLDTLKGLEIEGVALEVKLLRGELGNCVSIDLSNKRIGVLVVTVIAGLFRSNSVTKSLNLAHSAFGAEGVKRLGAVLGENSVLTSLNIGHNFLGPEAAAHLAQLLTDN
eukprot:5295412-Prymnesium_polylepis.1